MKSGLVVFSGYNQRAVFAFLRTLEERGVHYAIIASSKEDTVFHTTYKHKVIATRSKKELNLSDIFSCIEKVKCTLSAEKIIVAPSTEALNRFVLSNRELFAKRGVHSPLVEREQYEMISDKYKFGAFCKSSDIIVPQEYLDLSSLTLPCVAKPKEYTAKDGKTHSPVLLKTQEELEDFKRSYDTTDFYFQEFVAGRSLYLLYYFYKDGTFSSYSQENFVQQPDGKSMVASESSDFHHDEESKKYEKLFQSVEFHGIVMVEVISTLGTCYMVEANPRFWGPSQLFVDSRVNLFEDFLYDNELLSQKPIHQEGNKAKYYWGGGMEEAKKTDKPLAFHNYSNEALAKDLPAWDAVDVYNREDTREIYSMEMNTE